MSEQTKDGGQDLHARIMNLPWRAPSDCMTPTEHMGYSSGHRDARHAAADLAAEHGYALSLAQCRILELKEALRAFMALDKSFGTISDRHLNEMADEGQAMAKAVRLARSVLNKENGNGSVGVEIPFERGSWQHAVDDELVNYGRTSQSFATPHEAVKWLLSVERDVPLACLSVTPECRESGCAAARNAGMTDAPKENDRA